MSDLAATNCGCTSDNGCNSIIWIILLLCCCGGNGSFLGGNNCGGGNDCCWIIILLLWRMRKHLLIETFGRISTKREAT